MKIALFHTTLPLPGRKAAGVEQFVHRLASSLTESNYDVEVVSLVETPPGAIYRNRRLFANYPFLLRQRFLRLMLMPALLNFCDFGRYDVVHFHGDDWFCFRRGAASVRSFHGSALHEGRSATSLRRRLMMRVIYPLEQLAGRLADVVVGVGPEAAALYRADAVEKLFISDKKFHAGEKSAEPTLMFIGGWEGRKRGRFVAETFVERILPRVPAAKLLMASDQVPAHPAIVDLRNPAEEELAAALRASWALLSASTYEGFGIPYLEAMASGTAVVATRNSGAEFVLAQGEAGEIVDDAGFADAALALLENPERRRRLEVAGLARAAAFSEPAIVAEHIDFYRLAIERFPRR